MTYIVKKERQNAHPPFLFASLSVYFYKLKENEKQMVREIDRQTDRQTDRQQQKEMLSKHYNIYIKLSK